MSIFDYIIPEYFILSFVIGILYALYHKPDPVVIHKHPTLFNTDSLVIRDDVDNCWKFHPEEVGCPAGEAAKNIHQIKVTTI